ncbi:hypothetical protein AB0C38_06495 [Amycolatopsis sp. NPDC048633]|uniref:hypothetical protein n=1 Tax=Amycolatopsis sp. NPDC048633 TaxID=3157095 RepID=UPI0033FDC3A7
MPTADLRVFRCTSGYNSAGEHVLEDAVFDRQGPMPIRIPSLLEVNALATPLHRALTYRLKQHELNLVLSFLKARPTGGVAARLDDLRAAARHIRGFVIESVGMGMLTATMRDFYRWSGNHEHLEHFDALPLHIKGNYLRGGVRPDLLFLDPFAPKNRIAGEARGRSTKPLASSMPSKAQQQRLDEILDWSARHSYHPVTMAWTCFGGPTLSVDLFHIEFPPPAQRRSTRPPDTPAPTGSRPRKERSTRRPGMPPSADEESGRIPRSRNGADRVEQRPREESSFSDQEDDRDEVRGLQANVTTSIERLWRTAPPGDRTQVFNEGPVRGDWVSANLLGAARTHLFLGVLGEEPPAAFQRRLRERSADSDAIFDPIQVDVLGRLIIAVSLDSEAPPLWQEVAARLG